MGLFRRSDEPSEQETFLLSAVAAVGFTAENVAEARKAGSTDFLKALDQSAALAAIKAERDAALASAASAKTSFENLSAALSGSGFTADQTKDADSLKAALDSKINSKAAEKAVEISASRGIKPVENAPAPSATQETKTRAEFEALSHDERNAFMKRGGKIEKPANS